MPVVLLRFPDLESSQGHRPRQCPHCGSSILQRWGGVARKIQDTSGHEAQIYRYRCSECMRTFRVYPRGFDRSSNTLRIRYLAALAWAMGMSYREVAEFLKKQGIDMSHTTVWRDGKEVEAQLNETDNASPLRRYSIDNIFLEGISSKLGIVIAIDLGDGKLEVLGTIDEYNPRNVKSWLELLVRDVGIEILQLGTGELKRK